MTDQFFDEWVAYQKLVDHDYMGHRGFFRRLEAEIRNRHIEPLTILDLGCGDVSPIKAMLQNIDICLYHGVDESQTALSRAADNLKSLKLSFELLQGDILEVLPQLSGPYDVILASFSLHHMQKVDSKQQVLEACRRILEPGGSFFVIDVFSSKAQDRDRYIDDWTEMARNRFIALNELEMSTLLEHARTCDFPESVTVYREMAAATGYTTVNALERDITGNYRMLLLH
jgi:ubiquinone/menaquinone biosynthesis C-methylase UbiE